MFAMHTSRSADWQSKRACEMPSQGTITAPGMSPVLCFDRISLHNKLRCFSTRTANNAPSPRRERAGVRGKTTSTIPMPVKCDLAVFTLSPALRRLSHLTEEQLNNNRNIGDRKIEAKIGGTNAFGGKTADNQ